MSSGIEKGRLEKRQREGERRATRGSVGGWWVGACGGIPQENAHLHSADERPPRASSPAWLTDVRARTWHLITDTNIYNSTRISHPEPCMADGVGFIDLIHALTCLSNRSCTGTHESCTPGAWAMLPAVLTAPCGCFSLHGCTMRKWVLWIQWCWSVPSFHRYLLGWMNASHCPSAHALAWC